MKCKIEKYGIIDKGMGHHGWPTCALLPDERIMVVASADRVGHVCPFGKVVAYESEDVGESWSKPRILANTPLDDRDAGILVTRSGTILVNWFTSICWLNYLEKPEYSARRQTEPLLHISATIFRTVPRKPGRASPRIKAVPGQNRLGSHMVSLHF